jgi:hypothetical protein
VVFDQDYCGAAIDEAMEDMEELGNVGHVETDCGFL